MISGKQTVVIDPDAKHPHRGLEPPLEEEAIDHVQRVQLLNAFPHDLALASVEDHAELVRTFDYTPTTLEMETLRR